MDKDLEGKTILLTGATEGIGKAAAGQLVRRGASLTLVARNPEKGRRVQAELEAAGGGPTELLVGDLSTLAGIRDVAAAFKAKHHRLDVLANNAGGLFNTLELTPDGFEKTFALNHLSYFLMTHELLPLLKVTPGARVVNTSSDAHRQGKMDLDDIVKRPSGTVGFRAYGTTKLANILFTRELARRLKGTGVIANCYHPGFVSTGFGLNNGPVASFFIKLAMTLVARSPQKGAETLVWLTSSPEASSFSGEYFMDKKVRSTTAAATDDEMAGRLWELSERLCGLA